VFRVLNFYLSVLNDGRVLQSEDALANNPRTVDHTGIEIISDPLDEVVVNCLRGLPENYLEELDISNA
jgi:hypothetical protein